MEKIVLICILCIFLCSHSKAQHNFGLCSQVYQMYQYCTNRSPLGGSVGTVVTGRRIGKNGPRGEIGKPGVVNYTAIDATIEIKLEEIEARFNEKHAKYEKEIAELKSMMNEKDLQNGTLSERTSTETVSNNFSAISYKNKCFVPVMDRKTNLTEAREICAGMSGNLANIYDETHFNLLMSRIRKDYMNGNTHVALRLGMTIQPSTHKVTLRNGSDAEFEYMKWYPKYPRKIALDTALYLWVMPSESDPAQYMYNYPPNYQKANPLCEI